MVKLHGRTLSIASEQSKDVSIILNSSTKITRRSTVGDDDDEGSDDDDDKTRKWQFSVEVANQVGSKVVSTITIFSTRSSRERERWLSALLVVVKHCHSVASARLSQLRNRKLYLERELEVGGLESSESGDNTDSVNKLRTELLALTSEIKVLQRRKKENR
jgi:hypothetical protein